MGRVEVVIEFRQSVNRWNVCKLKSKNTPFNIYYGEFEKKTIVKHT